MAPSDDDRFDVDYIETVADELAVTRTDEQRQLHGEGPPPEMLDDGHADLIDGSEQKKTCRVEEVRDALFALKSSAQSRGSTLTEIKQDVQLNDGAIDELFERMHRIWSSERVCHQHGRTPLSRLIFKKGDTQQHTDNYRPVSVSDVTR